MDCSALAKSYKTLSYTNQLRDLLAAFSQTENYENLNKFELAKIVSDIVFSNYNGEQIIKYMLAKDYVNKNNIAAFEVRVKSSRADFLVIDGNTKSFEVKSKIDTLCRLKKQVNDYGDVFEYNTVVVDEAHADKVINLVPDYYGIWIYSKGDKIKYRVSQYSPNINSEGQLSLLNKEELRSTFGMTDRSLILSQNNSNYINDSLKIALKNRYEKRWIFIKNNWRIILPIDVQFFFNTNVKPEIIYGI